MMSSLRWRRVRCRGRRRPPARTNPGRAPPLGAGGEPGTGEGAPAAGGITGPRMSMPGGPRGNVRAQWPLHALAPNRLAAAPGAPAHAGRVLYRKALIFAATSSWPALRGQSQRVRDRATRRSLSRGFLAPALGRCLPPAVQRSPEPRSRERAPSSLTQS
jgi:hypothetical protein